MSFARGALLFALFICIGLALAGDAPTKQEKPGKTVKPTREQIAQWIKQLGDNEFAVREEATQKLWEAGDAAEAALAAVLKSDDAEIARRAQEIIDKFKLGIYPSTPRKVVDIINRFQASNRYARKAAIGELIDAGPLGCKAVVKLIAAEEDKAARGDLLSKLAEEMPRALATLLPENDFASLETFVSLGLEADDKQGLSNAAAYWLMRGQLDQKIAHYKDVKSKGTKPQAQAEILAYLYRAKGDLMEARAAFKRAERLDLAEAVAFEARDWKDLAQSGPIFEISEEIEKQGFRAAYSRLAGNRKQFEETLDAIRNLKDQERVHSEVDEDKDDPTYNPHQFYVAKAFFLNQQPKEGLERLLRGDQNLTAGFEILVAQLKYADAFELVDKARKNKSPALPVLEILQARTLYNLGEKEKAVAIFSRYAEQIKPGNNFTWFRTLVDSEHRAGLTDQAFAHCVQVLVTLPDPGWQNRLLGKLFPKQAEHAEALLKVLTAIFPLDGIEANMKRLRDLLEGKVTARELARWIENAGAPIKNLKSDEAERWRRGLAEAALACGQEDQARSCLEKAGNAEALLKLGDLFAAKKEWDRAGEHYLHAWEKDRQAALPLYLSGKALVAAGKTEEGKKRMESAHWLPLGNERARFQFCDSVGKRGDTAGVQRETALLLKLSQPNSYYFGDAVRRLAFEAYRHRDMLRSAELQEQAMLRCLRTGVSFVAKSAYAAVPCMIYRQRAAGLLATGKTKEALQQVALSEETQPGNIDLAILVVPELERLGLKKEADNLFSRTLALCENLCKEYPKCPWAHNSYAWLAACCRRNLDDGLVHAQKAVELAPQAAGHLDTLAEVYFQRGETDRAIQAEKKVVALAPKRVYFRKQLKRFEAGNPKAPLPPESEEEEDD